jgi:hypothetical protein
MPPTDPTHGFSPAPSPGIPVSLATVVNGMEERMNSLELTVNQLTVRNTTLESTVSSLLEEICGLTSEVAQLTIAANIANQSMVHNKPNTTRTKSKPTPSVDGDFVTILRKELTFPSNTPDHKLVASVFTALNKYTVLQYLDETYFTVVLTSKNRTPITTPINKIVKALADTNIADDMSEMLKEKLQNLVNIVNEKIPSSRSKKIPKKKVALSNASTPVETPRSNASTPVETPRSTASTPGDTSTRTLSLIHPNKFNTRNTSHGFLTSPPPSLSPPGSDDDEDVDEDADENQSDHSDDDQSVIEATKGMENFHIDSIEHMCICDISIDTVKQFINWFVLHPIKSTKKKNNALWELHVQYPISSSSSTKRIGHSKRIGVTDVTNLTWLTHTDTTPEDLDMCILTIDKCHSDLTIQDILA